MPTKKKVSRKNFSCIPSKWPGFKRGGGGAGYRCYSHSKGKIVPQQLCTACPATIKTKYNKKTGKYSLPMKKGRYLFK